MKREDIKEFANWLLSIELLKGSLSSVSSQRSVILSIILNEGKPITIQNLAKIAGIGERTIYRTIEELEASQLIRKENEGYEHQDGGTVFRYIGKI